MGHSDFFFFLKVEASIAVGEILLEINYVEQSYPLEYIIQDFTTAGSSPWIQSESNLVRTISILPAARSAPLWEKELTLIKQNIRKVSYLIYSKNYTASHLDLSETGRHLPTTGTTGLLLARHESCRRAVWSLEESPAGQLWAPGTQLGVRGGISHEQVVFGNALEIEISNGPAYVIAKLPQEPGSNGFF